MDKIALKGTLPEILARIAGLIGADPQNTKIYQADIKLFRKKRSLDANSYYWVLLSQYANWAEVSKERLHNEMLMHYGQDVIKDDGNLAITLLPIDEEWRDRTENHVRPIDGKPVVVYGETFKPYVKVRGSREYDSYEMAKLINGLISEIQGSDAHIQVMTPRELATLKGYSHEPQKA